MYRDFTPFYMNFQNQTFWEQERMQERENQLMRSFYPQTAREVQQRVEEECDKMDYPGSFLYDEYPDKFMMEQICSRIRGEMETEERGNQRGGLLDELIHVLLFQEMRRRRCRRHRCGRYF